MNILCLPFNFLVSCYNKINLIINLNYIITIIFSEFPLSENNSINLLESASTSGGKQERRVKRVKRFLQNIFCA